MKVTTVEKEVKTEQQVTITRSELEEILKKTAGKVIAKLDVSPITTVILSVVSADLCVGVIETIFEKEDK